jgi:diphosphoinositol-polyphosphate diphosphatase
MNQKSKFITLIFFLQILLVSSSNENSSWIVPGGGLEPNEEPPEAAVREVMEEAGVSGRLGICLGVFEVLIFRSLKYVTFLIKS